MIEVKLSRGDNGVTIHATDGQSLDEVLSAALKAWDRIIEKEPEEESCSIGFGSGCNLITDRVHLGDYVASSTGHLTVEK